MSPVFAHGHLRLYLLSLLAQAPRHGYELIQALGDRFGGTYSPSAGTIYPRLAKLEDEGLVTKTTDGRKTVYAITDAGRVELDERSSELDDIEDGLADSVRRLAEGLRVGVSDAMKSLRADLAAAALQAKQDARETTRGRPGTPGQPAADGEVPTVAGQPSADRTRQDSFAALKEAEHILNEFRQQVRTMLRSHATHDEVSDSTVSELQQSLEHVRDDIRSSLRR